MAGPVVDVLLCESLTRDAAAALVRNAGQGLGFHVTVPRPLDGGEAIARVVTSAGHDIDVLVLPAEFERDPGELDLIEERTGCRPAGSIQLMSWVRRRVDRDQARLALALLHTGAGDFVQVDGAIRPRANHLDLAPEAALSAARTYVAGRPGRAVEIPYQTAAGDMWLYHVVDARFLQGWIEDPDFQLPN